MPKRDRWRGQKDVAAEKGYSMTQPDDSMTSARADEEPGPLPTDKPRPPTVAIYQNPDHVSGILQQLGRTPLPDRMSRTSNDEHERSQAANTGTAGGGEVNIDVAGFSAGAHAGGDKGEENLLRQLGGTGS